MSFNPGPKDKHAADPKQAQKAYKQMRDKTKGLEGTFPASDPSNLISWSQRKPDGILSIEVASAGSTKPGNGTLTPIAAGFLRWNAIVRPGVWVAATARRDGGPRSGR